MTQRSRRALYLKVGCLLSASLVLAVGSFWAFQRGAGDFSVFHEAWRLVLVGRGQEIYHSTPDRFLYSPGFAWILAPLGGVPRSMALTLWCLAKASAVLAAVFALGRRLSLWAAAGSVALLARPILIDFQYGQVNALILAACIWALLAHFGGARTKPRTRFLAWFVLGIAAVTKIYPVALIGVPVLGGLKSRFRARQPGLVPAKSLLGPELGGVAFGTLVMLLIPSITQGLSGAWALQVQWWEALRGRGLPMESHNQSFAAFLHHYFTATSTHVVALAQSRDYFIRALVIPEPAVQALTAAWALGAILFTLGWLVRGPKAGRELEWSAVLIGLLIVPSHLVWKPYFLFGLPLAAVLLHRARGYWAWAGLFTVFVLMNFTSVDFIGYERAGWIEASALMLWVHLAMLAVGVRLSRAPI